MALLFCDGFDHYATADGSKKWNTFGGTIEASNGRRGTGNMASSSSACRKTLASNYATLVVGVAVSFTNTTNAVNFIRLMDGASVQVGVQLNVGGTLQVERNGTLLGSASALSLTSATYYYVEFMATINDSTGSYEVKVNGSSVLSASSQDTKNTANAYANALQLSGASANSAKFDDLYVCDNSGSAPLNTFLGDCRIDTLLPNADGTYTDFTPSTGSDHYAVVDESTPNTTDYNSSSTAGHKDSYNMQNLAAITGTIYAIQTSGAVAKDDAGARSIKVGVRSSSTDSVDAGTALSTAQIYYIKISETDPATATAWTESGVNAAQALFEVV